MDSASPILPPPLPSRRRQAQTPPIDGKAPLSVGTPRLIVPASPRISRDVLYNEAPKHWTSLNDFNKFLLWCRENDINDVTIGTGKRILGKRHGSYRRVVSDKLNPSDMECIAHFVKDGAAVSVGDIYRGSYQLFIDAETRRLLRTRVTMSHLTAATTGMTVTLRLIADDPPTPEQLGIPQDLLDAFDYKYGLGFVCGKMESGKTWTVAARLHAWLRDPSYDRKILHFGSPIEFLLDFDHISQYDIPTIIASYPLALKMAKSATPDVIVMEEVNDRESMSMIIDSAQSGIAVLGTLHISCVAELPRSMMTYYPDAAEREARLYAAFGALKVVLVQRLEPAILNGDPTQPDGRVCVREYVILDDASRSRLLSEKTHRWSEILQELVSSHGCSMIDSARQLHSAGRLSKDTLDLIETGRAA